MGKRPITARFVRRDEDDRSFDREFWQSLGHEAIMAAAWEMLAEVQRVRGQDVSQPRLQRSVARFQRRGR